MKINREDIIANIVIVLDDDNYYSHRVFSTFDEAFGFAKGAFYAWSVSGADYFNPLVLSGEDFYEWKSINFPGHEKIKEYIKNYESKL